MMKQKIKWKKEIRKVWFVFSFYSFIKAIKAVALIAAVSVLNLASPKLNGIKPFCLAKLISSSLKSHSGPIKIKYFLTLSFLKSSIDFLSSSKQCAINLIAPSCSNSKNLLNAMA